MKTYWTFIKSYTLLAKRGRAIIVLTYMMPILFFLVFSQANADSEASIAMALGMALVISSVSNGLQGAGQQAVMQREAEILKRFQVAPISPLPILVAIMVSGLLLYIPAIAAIHLFSFLMYGTPSGSQWFPELIVLIVGNLAFRSIGLISGAVVNSPSEATMVTQVLYLPMLLLSGATVPLSVLPEWAQQISALLPATYLVEAINGILVEGEGLAENLLCLVALMLTVVVATTLSYHMFRWSREDKVSPAGKLALASVLLPFVVFAAL